MLLLALVFAAGVLGQCPYAAGCQSVNQIVYNKIPTSGSYNAVNNMDSSSCACSASPQSYSQPLGVLGQELSLHFRGPIQLLQMATYSGGAGGAPVKRDDAPPRRRRGHLHHPHQARQEVVVDANANVVVVTEVETITSTYIPIVTIPAPTAQAAAPCATCAAVNQAAQAGVNVGANVGANVGVNQAAQGGVNVGANVGANVGVNAPAQAPPAQAPPAQAPQAASPKAAPPATQPVSFGSAPSIGGWTRTGYYDAASGSLSGLTFLNHQGGTAGSGTWNQCWGNSLSYCASNGINGAASPQVLAATTVPSNTEFVVYSDQPCDSSCGFYEPGTPAYKGFSGATKAFLFEFTMPTDNSGTVNNDMPAIWALHASVARTAQYGAADCSCWASGCGELDLFEVISAGSQQLITEFHQATGQGGGSNNYFARPTSSSMKAAVIFDETSVKLVRLDNSATFDQNLASSLVTGWSQSTGASYAS